MKQLRIFLVVMVSLLIMATTVQAQATLGTNWTAQFFNNSTLSGDPVATAQYPNGLNFSWGQGRPRDGNGDDLSAVNPDEFSARFISTQTFDAGIYTFRVLVNEGVRVSVAGQVIIDALSDLDDNGSTLYATYLAAIELEAAGVYPVVVDYYDRDFEAVLQFAWQKGIYGGVPVQTIGVPVQTLSDGRLGLAPGQAPAAIYDNEDGGIDIYGISGDVGWLAIRITEEDLKDLPEYPETNLTIATTGNIGFYKLTTGEYQVNVLSGLDHKLHTCIFSSIPMVEAPVCTATSIYED